MRYRVSHCVTRQARFYRLHVIPTLDLLPPRLMGDATTQFMTFHREHWPYEAYSYGGPYESTSRECSQLASLRVNPYFPSTQVDDIVWSLQLTISLNALCCLGALSDELTMLLLLIPKLEKVGL